MTYLSVREGNTVSRGVMGKKLTNKMRSFIDAYFGPAHFNATEAVKLSAYQVQPKNARLQAAQLLDHPLIQEEIARRTAARQKKSEVKSEYLLEKLIQIIEDAEGVERTADKLKAIELAGKSIAMWKERQEISGPDGAAIQHEQKVKESVADFTSRIAGLAKRAGTSNVVSFPDPGSAG